MPRCNNHLRVSIFMAFGGAASAFAPSAHANPCAPVIEPLGTGTSGPVNSLTTALNTDGVRELYIGGDFSTVNGMTANHLAVWEGDDWRAFLQLQGVIGLPAPVGHLATAPNPALADDLVFALGTDDALGLLYFGSVPLEGLGFTIALINPGALSYWELSHLAYSTAGGEPSLLMSGFFFSQVPGEPATMLDRYRFDTSDWEHVVGPSGCCHVTNDFVEVESAMLGNGIFLTGEFSHLPSAGSGYKSFALLSQGTFEDIGGLSGGSAVKGYGNPDVRGEGQSLTIADLGEGESVFVGGNFEFAGGHDALNIARYDGTDWHPVGSGLGRPPVFGEGYSEVVDLASFDDGSGPALYAVVNTVEASNGWVPLTKISRWDGTKWHDVVSSFEGEIHDMLVHDDGGGPALYIAGEFSELNGVTVNNIARIRTCAPIECPADVTGDGSIDLADLNLVLANFGQATSEGDTNADGVVDLPDLNAVLANFGSDC